MEKVIKITEPIVWGRNVIERDWEVNDTSPNYYRIFYLYSGEALCYIVGQKIRLVPGKIYLFPISTPFVVRQDNSGSIDIMWIHFKQLEINNVNLLEVDLVKKPIFAPILELLEYATLGTGKWRIITSVLDVFAWLIQSEFGKYTLIDEHIQKISLYVSEHYTENLSNSVLAQQVYLDEKYLIRLMKKVFGLTPHQYVLNYRLFVAGELLTKGAKVSEAAQNSGFTDMSTFTKAFRRHYSETPIQYRTNNYKLKIVK